MNRKHLAILISSSILGVACGGATQHAQVAQTPITSGKATHVVPVMIDTEAYDAPAPAVALTSARVAGDYLVREITTGQKTLVMTERVLSKDGATAVLEVSFKDGAKADTYRVRVEETAAGEQTTDVTKLIAGAEHAFGVAAYEALLQKTVPAVQSNDGMLDEEPIVVEVAGKQVAATRTEYKVMIGGKPATMSVIENRSLGDMGGEIATADGKVLYRARIVEMGSAPVGTASR
jgi:hypothetical protein